MPLPRHPEEPTERHDDKEAVAQLWNSRDVATFLQVPEKTVREWRHKGDGPPYGRVGKHVRYLPEDVMEWFRKNIHLKNAA